MLNSGKQISPTKKKYSNSCVVRKKNSERNKKPFKLNGRSLSFDNIRNPTLFK